MHTITIYVLKVVLISAILWVYYLMALRNKKFHSYNRFYLLSSVLISLVLPFIRFDFLYSSGNHNIPLILQKDIVMDNIVITMNENIWTRENIIMAIYCLVAGLLVILFIASLWRIFRIKSKGIQIRNDEYVLIKSETRGTPFSFFRYIFWNPKIDPDTVEGKQIFQHELVHVRQKHSLDKLFINLVQIIFWFNPVFWFIKREINIVHEFLADRESLGDTNAQSFSRMALQAAYPGFTWPATNSFFYSPIKRRLTMLLKNNKQKVSYFGRLMVLPLTILVFIFFSIKAKSMQDKPQLPDVPKAPEMLTLVNDTIPVNPDLRSMNVVEYKGKSYVDVTWKNGKQERLSLDEARLKGVVIPPPPPPAPQVPNTPPPPPGPSAPPPISLFNLSQDSIVYVVDGKKIPYGMWQNISQEDIERINVIKGNAAVLRYGEDPIKCKGVIEIFTKSASKDPDSYVTTDLVHSKSDTIPSADDKVFVKVENEAAFPGGVDAWRKYITEKIRETLDKFSEKDFGTCIVRFIVDANGNVSNVVATTMQGTKLAEVSVDAIRKGPKWIPAQQNGKNVRAYRLQPVTLMNPIKKEFSINENQPIPDKVFTITETPAEFPGGTKAWSKYITRVMQNHLSEITDKDYGTCVVKFIVSETGDVSEVVATTRQGTRLAEIAVDAIRKGPKWIPARQNGKNVNAYRLQPITLKYASPKVVKDND